ncbi:MAG: acetyl-CoA carboxylase biotin carboxyl carrier protein subunit [Proteobacteria bacterium]|nr:acetyl-CoA carboxylase biotin carboxyl carrier protein subunit [Pseudomonadota bacterium]
MDAPQIKAFIDAMASSDLAEMEVSHEGWTLRLVRRPEAGAAAARPEAGAAAVRPAAAAPARRATATVAPVTPAAPATATPATATPANDLSAPMFGVLHWQPSPGAAPFVAAGQAVRAGQTLCVIEAMKIFNEVAADRDGIVDALLATGGAEVEAGQPLLRYR